MAWLVRLCCVRPSPTRRVYPERFGPLSSPLRLNGMFVRERLGGQCPTIPVSSISTPTKEEIALVIRTLRNTQLNQDFRRLKGAMADLVDLMNTFGTGDLTDVCKTLENVRCRANDFVLDLLPVRCLCGSGPPIWRKMVRAGWPCVGLLCACACVYVCVGVCLIHPSRHLFTCFSFGQFAPPDFTGRVYEVNVLSFACCVPFPPPTLTGRICVRFDGRHFLPPPSPGVRVCERPDLFGFVWLVLSLFLSLYLFSW